MRFSHNEAYEFEWLKEEEKEEEEEEESNRRLGLAAVVVCSLSSLLHTHIQFLSPPLFLFSSRIAPLWRFLHCLQLFSCIS